jgi:hypothetical protein
MNWQVVTSEFTQQQKQEEAVVWWGVTLKMEAE